MEIPAFNNLILEVTFRHFCHMLLVIHTKIQHDMEGDSGVPGKGVLGGQLLQTGCLSFIQEG